MRTNVCAMTILLAVAALMAMDGIAVTGINRKQNYSGTQSITAYTITNNLVASRMVLDSFTNTDNDWGYFNTPSIDPSGSYVVYERARESRYPSRHTDYFLSIAPLSGGGRKDICQLPSATTNVWWLHNGTIVYYPGDCYLRQVSFVKSGSAVNVYVKKLASFGHLPQGNYLDITMTASHVAYRIYNTACFGFGNVSAQTTGPIPADVNTHMGTSAPGFWGPAGCGNALAPLGEYTASFGGSGHEVCIFQDYATHATLFTFNNRDSLKAWCVDDMDTVVPNGSGGYDTTWKYPGGDEQGYSVNSKKWSTVALISPARSPSNRSDQFLINWQDRKAINTSKFFVTGERAWAQRGDLWVSTQADVDASLWSRVTNRVAEGNTWKALYDALPATAAYADSVNWIDMTQSAVAPADGRPTAGAALVRTPDGLTLRTDRPGPFAVRAYSVTGRRILRATSPSLSLPAEAFGGIALVEIRENGRTQVLRAAAAK